MKKITKWEYPYAMDDSEEQQYDYAELEESVIVDAKYLPALIPGDSGNPFIEALPHPRSEDAIILESQKPLYSYDMQSIQKMPHDRRKYQVAQLRSLRFPLPFHKELEFSFYRAVTESYRARYQFRDKDNKIPVFVSDTPIIQNGKLLGDSGSSANAGFSLLGCSGCGKSDSLKNVLSRVPQTIMHYNDAHGRQVQIVYLVVNCIANSNFSALYVEIADAIDRAPGDTNGTYKKMVESKRTLGMKAEKICELVEIFAIGIIILDEIQLIDFESTKENSFESLMTLANRTKVAISVVGTEDAFHRMFTRPRTARRLGNMIIGSKYCENKQFFSLLAKNVCKYQWFDEPVDITPEIMQSLYKNTHGIVDQLISLWMYINIDYLIAESPPEINAAFINKTAQKHYGGYIALLDNLDDPFSDMERQRIAAEANNKLNKLLDDSEQASFEKSIEQKSSLTVEEATLRRNVVQNIRRLYDKCSEEKITFYLNKALDSSSLKDEMSLTMAVAEQLKEEERHNKSTAAAKPKRPSQKSKLSKEAMVKLILES